MSRSERESGATLVAEIRDGCLVITVTCPHSISRSRSEDRDPPYGAPRPSEYGTAHALLMMHCAAAPACPCLRILWRRYGEPWERLITENRSSRRH